MTRLLVAIHPRRDGARVLAMTPSEQILLKAQLQALPRSRQALPLLLKALALWQDRTVHAVLVADGGATSCGTSSLGDFSDGREDPHYVLARVPGLRRPLLRDELSGMGRFADLAQLLVREVRR